MSEPTLLSSFFSDLGQPSKEANFIHLYLQLQSCQYPDLRTTGENGHGLAGGNFSLRKFSMKLQTTIVSGQFMAQSQACLHGCWTSPSLPFLFSPVCDIHGHEAVHIRNLRTAVISRIPHFAAECTMARTTVETSNSEVFELIILKFRFGSTPDCNA